MQGFAASSTGAFAARRRFIFCALEGEPAYNDEERLGEPTKTADRAFFMSQKLNLVVHVPPGFTTYPTAAEQLLLQQAGVRAIIAAAEGAVASHLPVVRSAAAEELVLVDGTRWLWLRGARASLLESAAALPERAGYNSNSGFSFGFVASVPSGAAASEAALRRSCILAWQLHATRGCKAIILPWPELEAAAAASGTGWDGIAEQLTRMCNPTWISIQGG